MSHACTVILQCCCFHFSLAFFNSSSNSKFCVNVGHGFRVHMSHACTIMLQCCCFHFSLAFFNSPSRFHVSVGVSEFTCLMFVQ